MHETWCPERGDIVWLTFDPSLGHEQQGRRPAIVVSPKIYNEKVGLILVCPVTRVEKGYPFEVRIHGDYPVSGVALADQVKSVDWRARNAEYGGHLTSQETGEIWGKIAAILQ